MYRTLTIAAILFFGLSLTGQNNNQYIDAVMPVYYTPGSFSSPPGGGDTIFIESNRTEGLIFKDLEGSPGQPLVVINNGGQVHINTTLPSAIDFRDCKYIKLSGRGTASHHYGFKFTADNCGVAFSGLSTHCEIEFVEIDHNGFFGILAKKDFGGNPPFPIPVFSHLVIHDNLIRNVTEGMYIGENKSPGMEFKHLRVFNNVVQNTGREGIQVANAVEDIAVYNNFVWNSGTDNQTFQANNIQIGDNTLGRFYNNVVAGAIEHSIIIFGSGDIEIVNNYFADSDGISIDNRTISLDDAPITVKNNYFDGMHLDYIVNNNNEINPIALLDNQWYGGAPTFFYQNQSGAPQLSTQSGNQQTPVTQVTNPDLNVPYPAFPAPYQDMGPQQGLSYTMNDVPQLNMEEEYMLDWGTHDTLTLEAYTEDGDSVLYDFDGLPDFIQVEINGNGNLRLFLAPEPADQGIYPLKLTLSDYSHGDKTRLFSKFIVRDPNNSAPQIDFSSDLQLFTLTHDKIDLPILDMDGDELVVTVSNLPPYMQFVKAGGQFYLVTDVRYRHAGSFNTITITADDQYGGVDSLECSIDVFHKPITPGSPVIRINCGGPLIYDTTLTWEDAYNQVTPFEVTATHRTGSHRWSGQNTTGAPDNIFGPFATEGFTGDPMFWSIPVDKGTYRVNLYFAERSSDLLNQGPVIFDLMLNGDLALDNFNIYEEAGLAALKKSFTLSVVQGETIDLEFFSVQNKPKINGIEVIYLSGGNQPPSLPPLEDLDICIDSELHLSVQASDPDGDPIKYLVSGLPAYGTATHYPDSLVLDFFPTINQLEGPSLITVYAIDANNTAVVREFFEIALYCFGAPPLQFILQGATGQHNQDRSKFSVRPPDNTAATGIDIEGHPNPVRDWLSVDISSTTGGYYFIELIDVNGRVRRIGRVNVENGSREMTIPLNRKRLPSGFYLLRTVSGNGAASIPKPLILR